MTKSPFTPAIKSYIESLGYEVCEYTTLGFSDETIYWLGAIDKERDEKDIAEGYEPEFEFILGKQDDYKMTMCVRGGQHEYLDRGLTTAKKQIRLHEEAKAEVEAQEEAAAPKSMPVVEAADRKAEDIAAAFEEMEICAKCLDMARNANDGEGEDHFAEMMHHAACDYEQLTGADVDTQNYTAMDCYQEKAEYEYVRVFGRMPENTNEDLAPVVAPVHQPATSTVALSFFAALFCILTSAPAHAAGMVLVEYTDSNVFTLCALAIGLGVVSTRLYDGIMLAREQRKAAAALKRAQAARRATPEYKAEQEAKQARKQRVADLTREVERMDTKIRVRKEAITDFNLLISMGHSEEYYTRRIETAQREAFVFSERKATLENQIIELENAPVIDSDPSSLLSNIVTYVEAHGHRAAPDYANMLVSLYIENVSSECARVDEHEITTLQEARAIFGYVGQA